MQMRYVNGLRENRPIQITCDLAEEHGFEYQVRPMKCDEVGCSGPFVDIVASWIRKGPFGIIKRPACCAVIELYYSCKMRLYGDAYKEQMLEMAKELEKALSFVAKKYFYGQFEVEVRSHDLKIM